MSYLDPLPPRRKDPAIDYLLALLITVGFCAVMVYGFRAEPEPDSQPQDDAEALAAVVMLPMSEVVPPERPYHNNIKAWGILRDPTIMSLPNDNKGFSEILRVGFERPVKEYSVSEPDFTLAPTYTFPPIVITDPTPDVLASVSKARLREPTHLPPAVRPDPLAPGVYWSYPNGQRFARLPPVQLDLSGFETPPAVDRPTILVTTPRLPPTLTPENDREWLDALTTTTTTGIPGTRREHLLRIRVETSCGDPRLDLIAIDHIRKHTLLYTDKLDTTDDMAWWLGSRHELIIHWRNAEGVKSTANPTAKEDWHDRGWY